VNFPQCCILEDIFIASRKRRHQKVINMLLSAFITGGEFLIPYIFFLNLFTL